MQLLSKLLRPRSRTLDLCARPGTQRDAAARACLATVLTSARFATTPRVSFVEYHGSCRHKHAALSLRLALQVGPKPGLTQRPYAGPWRIPFAWSSPSNAPRSRSGSGLVSESKPKSLEAQTQGAGAAKRDTRTLEPHLFSISAVPSNKGRKALADRPSVSARRRRTVLCCCGEWPHPGVFYRPKRELRSTGAVTRSSQDSQHVAVQQPSNASCHHEL